MRKLPLEPRTWEDYKFQNLNGGVKQSVNRFNCLHLICKFIVILIYTHFSDGDICLSKTRGGTIPKRAANYVDDGKTRSDARGTFTVDIEKTCAHFFIKMSNE